MRSLYGAQPNQSLITALAHYHAALDNYFIGGEALVVEHLYMAAEALREPVLAQFSATTGRSEADIMAGEGHEGREHLLAWSRRELIFAGHRDTYVKAKKASEAMEHGHMSIGEIRALAESVCQPTFAHVRRTLIELLNVAPEIRRRLLERFQKPADSQSMRKRVVGVLVGDAPELAAHDQMYPILVWHSKLKDFALDEEDNPKASFDENLSVRTHNDIGFQLHRLEIYGRADDESSPVQLQAQVTVHENDQTRSASLRAMSLLREAVTKLGAGPEELEYRQPLPTFLQIFNRCRGLSRGCLTLLQADLPEESFALDRMLFSDAMKLHEARNTVGPELTALAIGWRLDSLASKKRLLVDEDGDMSEEVQDAMQRRTASFTDALREIGLDGPRSFKDPVEVAAQLERAETLKWLTAAADELGLGSDLASDSRVQASRHGHAQMHDTSPGSWLFPLAAVYAGYSYLYAVRAACSLFGWDCDESSLSPAETQLEALDNALQAG